MTPFRLGALIAAVALVASPASAGSPSPVATRVLSCDGDLQTEDPLSPPCIATWSGDNHGDTARGVSRHEVVVALYNDLGIAGGLGASWLPEEDPAPPSADWDRRDLLRTVKAQLVRFQERFQTYGRTVRLVGVPASGTSCAHRRGDAASILGSLSPFASVVMGIGTECFLEAMAEGGAPSFTLGEDIPSGLVERLAPHVWSWFPDGGAQAQTTASFICRTLSGLPARFSADPRLAARTRVLGVIRPLVTAPGGAHLALASEDLIHSARSRCGVEFFVRTFKHIIIAPFLDDLEAMRRAGVTTVVCYCARSGHEADMRNVQATASGLGYFPEWVWGGADGLGGSMWFRRFAMPGQVSLGVSHLWRLPGFAQQFPQRAFAEIWPDAPNERRNWQIYHSLLLLFSAVQRAGPDLNVGSVAEGMRGWVSASEDPAIPKGGFGVGSGGGDASAFLEAATAWWWDPAGMEPGAEPGEIGCVRLMRHGHAIRVDDWPVGDDELFDPSMPCNGPPSRAKEH